MTLRNNLMATTIGALCWVPQVVSAQVSTPTSASSVADRDGITDIVVTARRVEESLQTTPVAVTALGSEALARAQVVTIQDLQRTAPSLVVASGSRGVPAWSLFQFEAKAI